MKKEGFGDENGDKEGLLMVELSKESKEKAALGSEAAIFGAEEIQSKAKSHLLNFLHHCDWLWINYVVYNELTKTYLNLTSF